MVQSHTPPSDSFFLSGDFSLMFTVFLNWTPGVSMMCYVSLRSAGDLSNLCSDFGSGSWGFHATRISPEFWSLTWRARRVGVFTYLAVGIEPCSWVSKPQTLNCYWFSFSKLILPVTVYFWMLFSFSLHLDFLIQHFVVICKVSQKHIIPLWWQ